MTRDDRFIEAFSSELHDSAGLDFNSTIQKVKGRPAFSDFRITPLTEQMLRLLYQRARNRPPALEPKRMPWSETKGYKDIDEGISTFSGNIPTSPNR